MVCLIRGVLDLGERWLEVQPIVLRERGFDHGQLMEVEPVAKIEDQQFHERHVDFSSFLQLCIGNVDLDDEIRHYGKILHLVD